MLNKRKMNYNYRQGFIRNKRSLKGKIQIKKVQDHILIKVSQLPVTIREAS